MGRVVVSYSLTGNNGKLAESLASILQADHIKISEDHKRTTGMIAKDMIFNRKPKINADFSGIGDDDQLVFVAPVWMGAVAAPVRTCLAELKQRLANYSFVSVSGGALGPNPKLETELTKRTGIKPSAVIDMQIVNLMKDIEKPTSGQTSTYQLTEDDVSRLAKEAAQKLG